MIRMIRFAVAITLALILAACGGGGDGEEPPANQPPSADAGADQTVDAGDTVTLDGSGSSDPDGTVAGYQWTQSTGPVVSLSNEDQASASFVAPELNMATELVFRLTVTDDDGEAASDDVSVTVQPRAPANQPPSADAGADQTVDAGDTVTLDGSGSSDPDGTVAGYQWTQSTGPVVSLSNEDQASASFVAPKLNMAAELVFRLTVTDDDGETASDDVSVTVRPEIDVAQYLIGPVEQGESPGLIAAVIDAQGVVRGLGAAGVRRQGSPERLTVNDVFHIASDGKAMTATMLAVLIDDGIFPNDWDTTIADVFPELGEVILPAYHDVTLFQLLRMTGGVVGDAVADWNAIGTDYQDEPDIIASRYALVRDTLKLQPADPAGQWIYSSLGYVVAGAMAEKLTGESWETLMETHLLDPLGMTTAGFGFDWPDTPSAAEWGHFYGRGEWTPVELSSHLPYAELIGPGGGVHLSVEDWAKFIALWFPGQTPAILDRAALDELLVTAFGFYAPGWFVNEGDSGFSFAGGWTGGPGISHYGGGDVAGFSAAVRILPDRGIAYVAFANAATSFSLDGTENEVFASLDAIIANLHDDPDVQDIVNEF